MIVCTLYIGVFFRDTHGTTTCSESLEDVQYFCFRGGDFAAAIYENGAPTVHTTFHRYVVRRSQGGRQSKHDSTRGVSRSAGAQLRRYNEKEMVNDINTLLESWKKKLDEVPVVYIRCSKHERNVFFGNENVENKDSKYKHIPFETENTSLDEVKRVYTRLHSVGDCGSRKEFEANLENPKNFKINASNQEYPMNEKNEPLFISSLRTERRAEKQRWPSIDADTKEKLHEAFLADDYDQFTEVFRSANDQFEVKDYLSSIHPKLHHQSFLHLACRLKLSDTVEFLLDIDCDPTLKDAEGKVPYQLCGNDCLKEVFSNFRANNPYRFAWTRCHIPEPVLVEEQKTIRDVQRKIKRNVVKERRNMKRLIKEY